MKNGLQPINNIKSIKILKTIFNHLRNNKKFIIMNYNKFLQNKFGLTIDDYKQKAKRIKVGGLNGYGKEYISNSNILIFEGKYLNGKRNGCGIEYDKNCKIKYKGEYLNGKRNGSGIEYDENCKIKFEGEYLNGKIFNGIGYDEKSNKIVIFNNGIGKELYTNGLVQFEGNYYNGKKWSGKGYTYYGIKLYEIKNGNGYIREYNPDGTLLFKGHYINGEKNENGQEYLHGKLIFKGNYKNGVRNGKGKEYYDNLRIQFEGEYLDGKRWNGILYYYNGNKKCEIKEGKEEIININNIFEINFDLEVSYDNLFEDFVTLYEIEEERNFIILDTPFEIHSLPLITYDDLFQRYKNDYYDDVLKFKGEYINGELNGKGKQYFFDELIFEGEYMDGERNGFGKDYYINKKIKFKGEYQNGKRNGKGKEYDYFGRLIFEGEYVDNKRINGIIYKYNNNDFSKYIYLIPSKYFKQCDNKVPIDILKKYYNEYHIKSSGVKHLRSKLRLQKPKNEKIKVDKRKNKWEKNKKLKY